MQNSDIHRESQDMEENNGSKSIKTTYIGVLSKKQKANELLFSFTEERYYKMKIYWQRHL